MAPRPGKEDHLKGKREGPEERKPFKGREGRTQKPGNQGLGIRAATSTVTTQINEIRHGSSCSDESLTQGRFVTA
jgi:hypothetical protein